MFLQNRVYTKIGNCFFVLLFSLLLFRAEVFSQTQAVSSETGTVRIPELKVYTPKIRAGITPGKTLFLSLQDAIGRVLEHNLDIQMEKNNIRSKEASLLAAKGLFDFSFGSQFGYLRSNTPTVSALQGDPRSLFTETYNYGFNVTRELSYGANVKAEFNNTYLSTNNRFFVINPIFLPQLSVTYRQPLMRNFGINQNRRNLKALKEQLSIADMSFRKKLIELIARTQSAYYDLAFALENEKIQCDAVNLAAEQLRRAQTEVESGRVAPIEVDAVEAEFERRKEIAISELMSITQAENRLKNLILHDPSSDEWNYQILPTDKISFLPEEIDLEQAIETAMKKRPEIEEMNLQEKINRVEVDYMKNQAKPQIDVFYRFSTEGVAGGKDAPNFFNFKQQPDFIGGYATALRNIFGFRTYEIGASFNIPFRNRTAKANLTNALISSNQIDIQKKQLLQSILTEVRNAVQNLDVAAQRVEATASAVKAAEKQLIAEQVRFDVGLSTNYFVLEKQNNLSAARSRQLRAITDYIKARAELEKVIASNLP